MLFGSARREQGRKAGGDVNAIACACGCGTMIKAGRTCHGVERRFAKNHNSGTSTHGQSGTPQYQAWFGMINRCSNPDCAAYPRYGGRGIVVCDRWLKYENFFFDMGPRPEGKSLERKNNDGNYEPDNCKWATAQEQSENKRNNIKLSFHGRIATVAEWARIIGCSKMRIHRRLKSGLNVRDTLNPARRKTGVKPRERTI
jgi:hypothetical protein